MLNAHQFQNEDQHKTYINPLFVVIDCAYQSNIDVSGVMEGSGPCCWFVQSRFSSGIHRCGQMHDHLQKNYQRL